MRATRVYEVTAAHGHLLHRRNHLCVAGFLVRNRISDGGRSRPTEGDFGMMEWGYNAYILSKINFGKSSVKNKHLELVVWEQFRTKLIRLAGVLRAGGRRYRGGQTLRHRTALAALSRRSLHSGCNLHLRNNSLITTATHPYVSREPIVNGSVSETTKTFGPSRVGGDLASSRGVGRRDAVSGMPVCNYAANLRNICTLRLKFSVRP
ncbi:hypothetical protein EVAR_98975_1 [Eumeta japonica]|uniref:Uncharacterized protein n=1 Tax=Eumeta variegata TaxID=151549 RepID=A0A4C1YRI0_EUMVA|nr:hypothetical protein EVAR_98975_1 [Eumeta japonica]